MKALSKKFVDAERETSPVRSPYARDSNKMKISEAEDGMTAATIYNNDFPSEGGFSSGKHTRRNTFGS